MQYVECATEAAFSRDFARQGCERESEQAEGLGNCTRPRASSQNTSSLLTQSPSWLRSRETEQCAVDASCLAATGNCGTAVNWPTMIPTVVGVDGTSLNYRSTTRSEKTWSGTGGGIRAYVTMDALPERLEHPL